MMTEPDFVSRLISFLKEHNYPNVLSLSADELFEVFYASNRCYLVCWAFKLLNEFYGEVLEGKEEDKALLADLVSSHGFCSKADKVGFMEGDIPVDTQVHILYRMFRYIDTSVTFKPSSEQNKQLSIGDIDKLRQKDLNIFPTLGKIKTISKEERKTKLEELAKKIDTTTESLATQHSEPHKLSDDSRDRIKEIIKKMRENIVDFDKVSKDAVKVASLRAPPVYEVDPEDHEVFKSCSESLKVVAQYIEDLEVINNFDVLDCGLDQIVEDSTLLIELLLEHIHRDSISL